MERTKKKKKSSRYLHNEAARKILPFLLLTPSHLLMPIRKKSKDSPHTVNTASTQWEQQQRLTRAQAPPPCPRTSCLLVRGSNSSEVIRRLPACKKWREKPRSVWYPRWHLHAALPQPFEKHGRGHTCLSTILAVYSQRTRLMRSNKYIRAKSFVLPMHRLLPT